jgi:formylglycine-generating enzyme required for sulfatase activity
MAKIVVAALVVVVFGGIGTGGVLYFNGVEPVKSALDGIFGGSGSSGKGGGKKSTSGVVKLKSEPTGATVILEGDKPKELGTTPLETKLPTGKFVKVTFRLRGYHDKSETVDPENDYDIKAVLERDPSVDTSEPGTAIAVHTGGPEPDTAEPHHDTAAPDTADAEPAPPDGMTYVAGGHFRRGRDGAKDPYEGPAYDFAVTPFFLDLYEVSNADYADYAARVALKKLPTGWKGGKPAAGAEALPVTNVTWDEAKAYCVDRGARLPIEAEWEFAAKAGAEDRVYPWGDDFDATRVNGKASGAKSAMAVTSLRAGAAESGPLHMAGNVWEWTDSAVEIYPGSKAKKVGDDMRAIRGGSWDSPSDKLTTTARIWGGKGLRDGLLGFRCAKDL